MNYRRCVMIIDTFRWISKSIKLVMLHVPLGLAALVLPSKTNILNKKKGEKKPVLLDLKGLEQGLRLQFQTRHKQNNVIIVVCHDHMYF